MQPAVPPPARAPGNVFPPGGLTPARPSPWRWIVACLLLVFATATAWTQTPLVEKRVEIDKTQQILRAYEGSELVFETRVSTGRAGHRTPNGSFRAGVKHRMHYSKRYHNAPMPYAVQVTGHYFIHGFKDVPPWPASHGCIRVPLDGANPAAWFYAWVETGTQITISGEWQGRRAISKAAPRPAIGLTRILQPKAAVSTTP